MSPHSHYPEVIHAPDNAPAWSRDERVTKIVLGKLDAKASFLLPESLAELYPNLTHLHIWGAEGLSMLPVLPPKLQCLDVRKCGELRSLLSLPPTLTELILEELPKLTTLPLARTYPALWDLSLKGCTHVHESDLRAALKAMPALRLLDLSGCANLTYLDYLPGKLERIELNHCIALTKLTKHAPHSLRRLGLRGAKALQQLPLFNPWPDYLDLAGTENLTHMERPQALRTLFLHGSGLLVPPASEHGSGPDENVADRTLAFYKDVELCGGGDVKRCKLLILGNGGAGKSCLAHAIVPGLDPADAVLQGSTNGVQFHPWQMQAVIGGTDATVDVQLWDFGGQEIYHQTHRLFMSKGTVFVVVWNPAQDGEKAPLTAEGYKDEWRCLQYWLDFIHLACPWKPRIAVVCSHHDTKTAELEQQWRHDLSDDHRHTYPCYYIDSVKGTGELAELNDWLKDNIGQVVETQGTAVPSYWEIAQDLVGTWLPKQDPKQPNKQLPALYNDLTQEAFGELLQAEVERRVAGGHFCKLQQALADGSFHLNKDRLERTLSFLSRSGWVYWDHELFEGRVIVGQQWALEGIYAVLDRREGSTIYKELRSHGGQFTRGDLHRWVWADQRYSKDEEELLVTFMHQAGVCFRLVSEHESRWGRAVYKTFQHLPSSADLGLQRSFVRQRKTVRMEVQHDQLHQGHWQEILKYLGEHYGTDAKYAVDGFALTNKEGQHICLLALIDALGIGGKIEIQVAGPKAKDRADSLAALIRSCLPAGGDNKPCELEVNAEGRGGEPGKGGAGTSPGLIQVFFSYAWDPETASIPKGYEVPVDAIWDRLQLHRDAVNPERDKKVMVGGDSVTTFMARIKVADKVIVIHSDKYWCSPFCMKEFTDFMHSFTGRPKAVNDVLMMVEHPTSGWKQGGAIDGYIEHWEKWDVATRPTMLGSRDDAEALRVAVLDAFRNQVQELGGTLDLNQAWIPGKESALIRWVITKLGL